MPNQALAYHRVSPRVYDLTSLLTGNVRDQLLRATLVFQGLVYERFLTSSSRLLVLGGGAAGMSVAMTAAENGVLVTVIEKDPQLFSTLFQASFRRIDPTEYDWPHEHWTKGVFPFGARTAMLAQTVGTGSVLANSFLKEYQQWTAYRAGKGGRGNVKLLVATNAADFLPVSDLSPKPCVNVSGPWKPSTQTIERFDAVVYCFGFGREKTSDNPLPGRWGGYSGHQFWFDDDNLFPGHTPLPESLKRVVISGGGDGALQDVQRALTGWFGKELFDKLQAALPSTLDLQPERLRAAILAAEDTGRRAHAWKSDSGVPVALMEWHSTIALAVKKLVESWNLSESALKSLVETVFRPELLDKRVRVTWVTKEETPGYAYALNRFLVLLLEELGRASKTETGLEVLRGYKIETIKPPTGHTCVAPGTCFGHPHEVHITPNLASISSDPTRTTETRTAELILVRHGISPTANGGCAPIPEQMVPYDLPA